MIGVIFFWYVLLLLTGMYSHVMRALVSDLVHKRSIVSALDYCTHGGFESHSRPECVFARIDNVLFWVSFLDLHIV